VEYLFLTHCHYDHTGGAEEVRNRFDCAIVVHELDAPALEQGNSQLTAANWYGRTMQPFKPDVILSGPENQIQMGGRRVNMIHMPGHNPGSVVFLVESDDRRVLFGQDVHGPLHADFASDARAYRQSLQLMADLDADIFRNLSGLWVKSFPEPPIGINEEVPLWISSRLAVLQ
jgi:glyoxylase-like metal-dependent hydrolase (beta-lactamase superfamily II)